MKIRNRSLILILTICLLFAGVPTVGTAANVAPVISGGSITVKPGETFELPIYISNTYNLVMVGFFIKFDPQVIEFQSGTAESLVVPGECPYNSSDIKITGEGSVALQNALQVSLATPTSTMIHFQAEKKLLCKIKLKAKATAKDGQATVQLVKHDSLKNSTAVISETTGFTIHLMPEIKNDFTVTIKKGSSGGPDGDGSVTPTKSPVPTPAFVPVKTASLEDVQNIVSGISKAGQEASEYEDYKVNDYAQGRWDEFTRVQYNPDKVKSESNGDKAEVSLTDLNQGIVNASTMAPFLSKAIENTGAIDMLNKTVTLQLPSKGSATRYTVALNKDVYGLWSNDSGFDSVTFETPLFSAELAVDALRTIQSEAAGGCNLVFEKAQADGKPVYHLTVENTNGSELTSVYPKGVVLMMPVTLSELGVASSAEAYAVDANGEAIPSSVYLESENKFYAAMGQPGAITFGHGAASFSDLDSVSWAEAYINGLAGRKILSGVGDGKFDPNRNITREEFTKMIVGAFGILDETATCNFTDVPEGSWYYPYVATAAQYGLVNGMGNGEFGVSVQISRQDMATLAKRAADFCQRKLRTVNAQTVFSDDANIQEYAKPSITAMQMAGIISGMGDNRFEPNAFSTRAQAAKVIYMLFAAIK